MTERLRVRRDFLAAARGRRFHTPIVTVQAFDRRDDKGARAGFTVTKKVGGAVERNRIRRRLKEAMRLGAVDGSGPHGRSGHDYVLVARRDALSAPFPRIRDEIQRAFRALEPRAPSGRPAAPPS